MNKVPLSSIIEIISGGTPKTSVKEYWENGTIGWLSVTDFNNELRYVYETEKKITELGLKNSNTKLLRKDDIIISARGTVGALAQIGIPMCFNQSCFGLRGIKNIADNSFLYYCLKNYVLNIKRRSQGSVFDTINLDSFDLMEIEIPDFQYQKKIASVLSSLDSKIEINNCINAELEAMAKTLYDYWFVQFDFPNSKGKPYKSSGGKMIWDEKLKREIPEGWSGVTVDSILSKESAPKKISSSEFLNQGSIPIIDQSTDYIAGFTNDAASIIKTDEPRIIFGDHTRILKFINFDFARGADGTQILLSNTKRMPQHLLYHTLLKIDLSNYGYARHFKFLKENKIILPKEGIAQEFENKIRNNYEMIRHNIFENQKLSELRDWLLPMLMNGQVKVKDAEEMLAMAAEQKEEYLTKKK